MAEAIEANEKGDEAHLKQILEEYQSSPETVQGDGVGAEIVDHPKDYAGKKAASGDQRRIPAIVGLRFGETERKGRTVCKAGARSLARDGSTG